MLPMGRQTLRKTTKFLPIGTDIDTYGKKLYAKKLLLRRLRIKHPRRYIGEYQRRRDAHSAGFEATHK